MEPTGNEERPDSPGSSSAMGYDHNQPQVHHSDPEDDERWQRWSANASDTVNAASTGAKPKIVIMVIAGLFVTFAVAAIAASKISQTSDHELQYTKFWR